MRSASTLYRLEKRWSLVFIALPVIGFFTFTISAMVFSFWFSLTDFNPVRMETRYVGLENFRRLFADALFRQAVFNTFFLLISVPIGMFFGLLLSVYLQQKGAKNYALRLLYYLPAVSSVVAINIIFRYLFNGEFGLLNHLLNIDVQWLGTGRWPIKFAIIIRNVWAAMGVAMVLYLAGLNNIPASYYEAADIDGASIFQKFFMITVPLVRPISFFLIVTGIIAGMQNFADAQLLANGNPQGITVVYYIWVRGIDANRYGVASAASILLGAIIMLMTYVQFRRSSWVEVR
ncbi:MAG: sugar ABC transporter permease [Acholeplasmatales bacterium]|nr:MAG: sugar ABC transporter permease [Acholeplasmatales bacterium]